MENDPKKETFINYETSDGESKSDEEQQQKPRSCLERAFGKIEDGSLRGSIFSLATVTFGTGCLSFPQAFMLVGPGLGMLVLVLIGVYSYFTLYLLLKASIKVNVKDYNSLTLKILGPKFVNFAEVCNIVLCIGVVVSCIYAISDFSLQVLDSFGVIDRESMDDTEESKVKAIQMASVLIIQFFLCSLRDMKTLQIVSIVGTFALVYTILVVVCEMPFYTLNSIEKNISMNMFPDLSLSYLDTLSIFLFGFCGHNGLFPVFIALKNPTFARCSKVMRRSFYLELVLYFLIAFAGYFSTFSETTEFFITRPDIIGRIDYFMMAAKITLIICLFSVQAINYNLMMVSVKYSFFNNEELSQSINIILTVVIVSLSNVVTFFVTDVKQILNIIGGVSAVGISFIIPSLVYVKTNGYPRYHFKNILTMVLMVLFTLIGVACTVKGVYDFIASL